MAAAALQAPGPSADGGGRLAGTAASGVSKGGSSSLPNDRSVLVNGVCPLSRSAMSASGSGSPISTRARRKRSMLARSHGSRATRSSAMNRASAADPAAMYASASCPCALYSIASSPPSTQISTRRIRAGMWLGRRVTNSCNTAAAADQSDWATAVSAASPTTMKPDSGTCSAMFHPSCATSSRIDGSFSRSRRTQRDGFIQLAIAQLYLGHREQQLRIVAGRLHRQIFGGRGKIAARHERPRHVSLQLTV